LDFGVVSGYHNRFAILIKPVDGNRFRLTAVYFDQQYTVLKESGAGRVRRRVRYRNRNRYEMVCFEVDTDSEPETDSDD